MISGPLFVALPGEAGPRGSRGSQPHDRNPWNAFDPFGLSPEEEDKMLAGIEVSAKEEKEIGEKAAREYIKQLRQRGVQVVSRGPIVNYLKDLVETLRPQMKNARRYPTITVYYVDSPEIDARSFPGGTLVFFKGLLDAAPNEAALIAVVGHELSHLDRGHQLRRAKSYKLAEQTFTGTGGYGSPDRFMVAGAALTRIWSRPFRPEDESVADRDGVTWAYRAGYDSRELARLFLTLHNRQKTNRTGMPWFLASHPEALRRRDAVMARYDELQQKEPRTNLALGTRNLELRVARSRRVIGP
jgi:predicted Zn-dependent protease